MEKPDPIIQIIDEFEHPIAEWFSNFVATPVRSQIFSPCSPADESFQCLVMSIAYKIKEMVKSSVPVNSSLEDFCSILERSGKNFPVFQLEKDEDDSSDKPFSPFELSFDCTDDSDQEEETLECDLFRRVVKVFNSHKRSDSGLFDQIDINKDGKVTVFELRAELFRNDPSFTFEEAEQVFKVLDGDGDGIFCLTDLRKRKKMIEKKAEEEITDPMSCIVVSEPLDPNLIHGKLTVTVGKISGMKDGPRALKFRVKNLLEYHSSDFYDNNFSKGYRCEYLIENQSKASIQNQLEIEVLKKKVVEGFASFCWDKSGLNSEFQYRKNVDLKTSLGQSRGIIHLNIHWTPIFAKSFSVKEANKRKELRERVREYQKNIAETKKIQRKRDYRFTVETPEIVEKDLYLLDAKQEEQVFNRDQKFFFHITQRSTEIIRTKSLLDVGYLSPIDTKKVNGRAVDKRGHTDFRPRTPSRFRLDEDSHNLGRGLEENAMSRSFSN